MDIRIAIHLRRRCLENLSLQALGKTQHIDCPVYAGLRRLHRIMLVMDRRRRASQIVDLIDFHIERECDIVADHFEVLVIEQVFDIAARASKEVVRTDDDRSVCQQTLAQVRPKKAGTARDQYALLKVHDSVPSSSFASTAGRDCHKVRKTGRKCMVPILGDGAIYRNKTVRAVSWKLEYPRAHSSKAMSFTRARIRGSPS